MTDPKHPQKGTKKEQKPTTAKELSEEELKKVAGGMASGKKDVTALEY